MPKLYRPILFFLAIVCLINIGRIVDNNRYLLSAGDFYTYWYYGHFVRQGDNPWVAFATEAAPILPVSYLDGETFEKLPRPWNTISAPTNTTPLLLLLSLFSLTSWLSARWLWMGVNIGLAALLPLLLPRIYRPMQDWPRWQRLLLHLIFGATFAVRNTGGNGQTSLLVLGLMLWAWASAEKHPLRAAILLGIAISKYSLALPLVLLFLWQRRFKLVASAVAFQGAVLLLFTLATRSSLLATLTIFWDILRSHAPLDGIHFTQLWSSGSWVVAAGTGMLAYFLWRQWHVSRDDSADGTALAHLTLFNIFALWTLLIAYHGPYDAVLLLTVYAVLLIHLFDNPLGFSGRGLRALGLATALSSLSTMPPRIIDLSFLPTFPAWWEPAIYNLIVLNLVALLLLNCYLFWRSAK